MPRCYKCGETKSAEMFCRDRTRSSGVSSKCKECMMQRSENQMHIIRGCGARKREARRVYVRNIKEKCFICGYDKCKTALEFHHVDEKAHAISRLMTAAQEVIDREIERCIVVCANCHREIHEGLHNVAISQRSTAPLPLFILREGKTPPGGG